MAYIIQEITSQNTWDSFVQEHSPMALFQSWAWGEVEKKLGNSVWRWGWFDGKRLVGVAQIEKISARRGIFLHVRHGPIGKINFEDLKKLAKTEKAWFVRVSPQMPPQEEKYYKKTGFVPAPIHAMDAELCWVLDVDKSEEELLAGMRKTTRYEIRRAQKLGVKVTKCRNIQNFSDLYNETAARHNFVQHRGIKEEFDMLDTDLFVAKYKNTLSAAAIILYFGDEAIYHHGASIQSKVPASYLLQWEAIREAKKRGKKLYNFWGIAPDDKENHPWRGITLFKKGFGGREVDFMHAQDYLVSPFALIPRTVESLRKRLKGY
jgi:lipid II:glycine glycyltransferase (peptidoglycan interpeptide bridge formation enzyme)